MYDKETSRWAQMAVNLLLVRCFTRANEDLATLGWAIENDVALPTERDD